MAYLRPAHYFGHSRLRVSSVPCPFRERPRWSSLRSGSDAVIFQGSTDGFHHLGSAAVLLGRYVKNLRNAISWSFVTSSSSSQIRPSSGDVCSKMMVWKPLKPGYPRARP